MNICLCAQYIEVGPFSGAVSDSSAVIVYKVSLPGQKCRVEYSKDSLLRKSEFSEVHTTTGKNANYIKVALKTLEPETKYFYRLELNGEKLERSRGHVRTFSDTSKSFRFAFGNSLKSESKRSGLRAAVDNDILFFLNTGDLHYSDIDVADIGLFRNAYQNALMRKDMSYMGKMVPLTFIWDDHDFGPNNSDKTAPGRMESGKAYRECIPHYSLMSTEKNGAIYQSFTVNNTHFILTDLRSTRDQNSKPDNENKTMMGKEQLTWFKRELKESSLKYPLVIWVSSVPFTAEKRNDSDSWAGFSYERRVIANFVKEHNIDNLMIISGDAHGISYNIGKENNYSDYEGEGLFEILAAPLDNWATSIKGGPWTEVYKPEAERGQMVYGMVEVDYSEDKTTVRFGAFDTEHHKLIHVEKRFENILE
ncbi:phosphodiesterase/alkaline phosphatase D-like protein [Marinilabilia salmonicolor]|uniref:Phosphodiesterase/alkaline phosphatase D-like protein n=2 Tax=Marinilabilia salmonicolor TaxID=989 RepID=A0A368VCW8_9BACT|nr:phosphodiesterase/alkaline phosphatase D-like protein [Marinilabilia salmonicolor]